MKVYLSEAIDPGALERLARHFEIVADFDHPEELDAIIVRRVFLTREIIEKASKCRIISMHGVGLDTIDLAAAEEYGIPVVNVPGESAQSVAELAVAFMLALSRKLKKAEHGLLEGRYTCHGPAELIGSEIYGKTVGLVGFGHISRRVAEIMRTAFHCHILVYTLHFTAEQAIACGADRAGSLFELFEKSDYVSVSVPLSMQTRNMINGDVLSHAKPGLILVDTSRGGVLDEEALYNALSDGRIAAAGLDVSAREPMDAGNPLLALENCMVTPHIGASTADAKKRVGEAVVNHIFAACGIEAAQ